MSQIDNGMNKFESQLQNLNAIVEKWNAAMEAPDDELALKRDSCILRFELAFEVAWKCLQSHVRDNGFDSSGPRQSFENAFRLGLIEDEILWDSILKARNLAIHVYREEWANDLFDQLPKYLLGFKTLLIRLN